MKYTKKSITKFLNENTVWAIITLIVTYMFFLPPPFFLKHENGVVEKVYRGEISIPTSRLSVRSECVYMKFKHSQILYNTIYSGHIEIIEKSDLIGKQISMWYDDMSEKDKDIRLIRYNGIYIIPYNWIKGGIQMCIMALCVTWIVFELVNWFKSYLINKKNKRPRPPRIYSLSKIG